MRNLGWNINVALAVLGASIAQAATPAEICESGKNKEAGKYSYCRQKAEAKYATTGDAGARAAAQQKCLDKYNAKWPVIESKAGGACPSTGDQAAIQGAADEYTDNIATALAGGTLPDCAGDLLACQGNLGTCTGNLSTCTGDIGTCNATLGTTQANLTTCSGNLATCGNDLTTCNGNLTTTQASLTTCTGTLGTCNTNLSSTQASLTTCTGNLTTCQNTLATAQAGTATAAHVLSGQTFTSAAGTGVTGTMPNNGAVSITPGTAAQAIAAGYHNGAGSVAGDADLVAGNIVSGVNLFGVTGTVLPSQPLKSGQTTCWDPADNSLPIATIPCAGSGQDGQTLKGQPRGYTVNANGTITDNKTGLVWEKLDDNNASGIHDYSAQFTWANAFKKILVLNGNVAGCIGANNPDACCTGVGTGSCAPFAGLTDWRLPNVNELQTLADYGRTNPTIDPTFHTSCAAACTTASCSCTQSGSYWSSSTYQNGAENGWVVYFNGGFLGADPKPFNYYVRAVRGGS